MNKRIINSKCSFLKLVAILMLLIVCSQCTPIRAIRWRQPGLDDVKKFKYVELEKPINSFKFIDNLDKSNYKKLTVYLDTFLNNTNTNAFLIIKNDSIIYQRYAENNTESTLHPSFSIAKSYIGTLIGIAIDKKFITSSNDLVIKYLPELLKNDARFNELTIQHVLDMRAGFDFNEDKESMFVGIAKLYYGSALSAQISKLKFKDQPGKKFEYQSINTQLLAAILERATNTTVVNFFNENLWKPIGAESNALWSVDDNNMVKAFCCLNATALDFAKLGRLYLKKGNWNEVQVLSTNWINNTTNADTLGKYGYKNQWWACSNLNYFKDSVSAVAYIDKFKLATTVKKAINGTYYIKNKSNDYRAEGILGQILYVNPDNNVIIVRLGNYPNKSLYFNGLIPKIGREL